MMAVTAITRYDRCMSRWQPGARGRLEQAAMDLYSERGFDDTTVAEIAERAGLTERTFFRHFTDKRDVLFDGAGALQEFLVSHVDEAVGSAAPLQAIVAALIAAGNEIFEQRREFAERRQAIIAASAELRERELIKLATLASALADALRRRGVADPVAGLAAEAGIAIFKVAFQRWTADTGDRTLADTLRETAGELEAVAGTLGSPAR
jgi:AcrR family transcriptional regulator